jgi:uncharacterized membrane protein required for colicin V production
MLPDVLAIALIVVPLVLLARYASQGVTAEINAASIGPLNRGLGVALGLIRGIMMSWLIVGLMSWSFMRSAGAAIYTNQTISASSLRAELPIHDILCDKNKNKDWSLINALDQRSNRLSALAKEIVASNQSPLDNGMSGVKNVGTISTHRANRTVSPRIKMPVRPLGAYSVGFVMAEAWRKNLRLRMTNITGKADQMGLNVLNSHKDTIWQRGAPR